MVASWSAIEIVRYVFYAFKLASDKSMPYPLFWLRYSLFMVLYPSGITGEILQIVTATGDPAITPVRVSRPVHLLTNHFVHKCPRESEFIS